MFRLLAKSERWVSMSALVLNYLACMREIKFRAWDTLAKSGLGTFTPLDFDFVMPPLGAHVAWMQFTGLEDTKGAEIYEGDILKCPDYPSVHVAFEDGCFIVRSDTMASLDLSAFLDNNLDECEIIGNIYEKPELLN